MKKIFLTTIFLTFLFFPINSFGQFFDLFIMEETTEEEEADQEIVLHNLELYWSTDAYTPSNYQGRALPVRGGSVSVVADLKTSGRNPQILKYSWFLDDTFQESKSGYGEDEFQFGVRKYGGTAHIVLVKIFNESRSFLVEKSIEIPVVNAEVIIYPQVSDFYFSNQASEKYFIPGNTNFSFIAKPYFFDIEKLNDLNFEWSIPRQENLISSGYTANILNLTINKEEERTLEETLQVNASIKFGSRQKASQIIEIQIY